MYICAIIESMTFLRPEILNALILLAIPIIVHLFEFRIFKPTAFTNLLFLEHLKNEQHRYQKLKKWLVLMLRLGYFSGLILAFALPTIRSNDTEDKDTAISIIYLDNSFSATANNAAGSSLLSEAKEELYQWSKSMQGHQFNWFTNDTEFPNQSQKAFQQSILTLKAGPKQLSPDQVLLKAKRLFQRTGTTNPHLIWYTDFQNWKLPSDLQGISITVRPLNSNNRDNIILEEASIDRSDPDNTKLSVLISNNLQKEQTPTIRVYTQGTLFTQTGTTLTTKEDKTVDFDLGVVGKIKGMVTIEDRGLRYDDTLYFNIPDQPRVQILSIGAASTPVLRSIFDQRDFYFKQTDLNNLDFSLIQGQNLIILDQISTVSNALLTALNEHLTQDGGLVIIPEITAQGTLQDLLDQYNLGQIQSSDDQPKKLVAINTQDPFYKAMFEQEVESFQYPTIGQNFHIKSNANTLLALEQGTPYLLGKDKVHVFSGPITGPETNFDQSPLSVVTMIQLARQTRVFPEPYYPTLRLKDHLKAKEQHQGQADIKGTLVADQVVVLVQGTEQLIPRQKQVQDFIALDFGDMQFNPGHYRASVENEELAWFSFNHPRDESHLPFLMPDLDSTEITISKNMNLAISAINQKYEGKQLWVWFAIFALVCFLAEMFILKQTT